MYQYCKISPDGTKIALAIGPAGNHDIWVWDLDRENMSKLTFYEDDDYFFLWTPDGERIVFFSARENGGIYSKAANLTGGVEKLFASESEELNLPYSWSGDGSTLVIQDLVIPTLSTDIATLSLEGDREKKPLLHEKHQEFNPQVSPDGRWMAYSSDESGQDEIYVRPFPDVDSGGQRMVSGSGGNSPLWSPDGKELYYRNGEATMAVPVETEPTFNPGKPVALFRGAYSSIGLSAIGIHYTLWDIHPDGNRFLMMKPAAVTGDESEPAIPRKINVVMNWFEELKDRAPVD
jgi:Tol biopolymer transport system component